MALTFNEACEKASEQAKKEHQPLYVNVLDMHVDIAEQTFYVSQMRRANTVAMYLSDGTRMPLGIN
jgi:hypothetical protein